jgi:hypothetical protein
MEANVAQFDVLTSIYSQDCSRPQKNLSQDSQSLCQDMNPGAHKYEAEVLPIDCNVRLDYIQVNILKKCKDKGNVILCNSML